MEVSPSEFARPQRQKQLQLTADQRVSEPKTATAEQHVLDCHLNLFCIISFPSRCRIYMIMFQTIEYNTKLSIPQQFDSSFRIDDYARVD